MEERKDEPIEIKIFRTKETIKELINQSGLNVMIVEMILHELYLDVKNVSTIHLNQTINSIRKEAADKEEVTEDGRHITVPESDS